MEEHVRKIYQIIHSLAPVHRAMLVITVKVVRFHTTLYYTHKIRDAAVLALGKMLLSRT